MLRRIVLTVLLATITTTALAWSEAGHKLVGSIAFRLLSPDQQAKIVAILKSHPRWKEDFESKMSDDLASEDERNEWVFQQAACWPDIARGFEGDTRKEYHHGPWHYIDLPIFLTPEDQKEMQGKQKANVSLNPPAKPEDEMNVVQTLRLARRLLADKSTPDDKKAVMLCWIMHDVGDIHQPLHSSELYSRKLFPEGDRGGNSIKTEQRKNLHAVWDQFLGLRASFRTTHNRAIKTANDRELTGAGQKAADSLDEKTWLDESHALAESLAYDSEVMGYLRGYVDEKESPPIHLTERYLKAGGAAAEQRVIEAGYRLGAVLKQLTGE